MTIEKLKKKDVLINFLFLNMFLYLVRIGNWKPFLSSFFFFFLKKEFRYDVSAHISASPDTDDVYMTPAQVPAS